MTDEELVRTVDTLVNELNDRAREAASRNIEISLEERSVLPLGSTVEFTQWGLTMRKILV